MSRESRVAQVARAMIPKKPRWSYQVWGAKATCSFHLYWWPDTVCEGVLRFQAAGRDVWVFVDSVLG